MPNKKWLVALPAAAVIAAILYLHSSDFTEIVHVLSGPDAQCLAVYADILPEDARLKSAVLDGATLQVRYQHAGGEGSVTCDLAEGGELDITATHNRKVDVMWGHPEIRPRFKG